ncbi:MAG: hypothetical protein KKB31_05140 [Nanoarchaeota archaeon]|nr:hypothetical protein [Nanoarchaeota archaeon]
MKMIQDSMGENVDVNVKELTAKLQIAIGGSSFYDQSYKPRGETLLFKAYPYIDKITNFLQPVLGSINVGTTEFYFEKAQQLTISAMNDWGSRYQISPHGFEALKEADQKASFFNWIYIVVMLLPTSIFMFMALRKKKKIVWKHLIWIPITFIAVLVIIYAII